MKYSYSTNGFYDPAIHGNNIPADAVAITAAEHAALLDGQSNGKRIVADANGYPVLADPPLPPIEDAKAAKLAAIRRASQDEANALTAVYPDFEKLTWPSQEAEARVWTEWDAGGQVGTAPPTPTLDGIALARGLTLADLSARVIAKADLFLSTAAQIAGKRQALEDQMDAIMADLTAGTITEIEARGALDLIQW